MSTKKGEVRAPKINVTVVGGVGIGKSSLLRTLETGKFFPELAAELTVQEEPSVKGGKGDSYSMVPKFQKKCVEDGVEFDFLFQDTSDVGSAARTRCLKYLDCNLCLICFSYDDHASFVKITDFESGSFLEEVVRHCQKDRKCAIFVVGLKSDLEHKVSQEELDNLKSKNNSIHEIHSVSCKENKGISDLLLASSRAGVKCYYDNGGKVVAQAKPNNTNNKANEKEGGGGGKERSGCVLF